MWTVTTVGKLARRGRPVATLQLVTTPWQGLAMWQPGTQTRPWHRATLNPKRPQQLEDCALFDAPTRSHWGGFPQTPVPANLVSPVSVAGHRQNVWHLESGSGLHMGVRQHWHVFAADSAIEVARFAKRFRSSSDEEPTHFICSPHLPQFIRTFWSHMTTGMTGLWFVFAGVTHVKNLWTRRCNTLSQMMGNSI